LKIHRFTFLQSELFQDDLFPPTKVTWTPAMSSREWFNGANKQASRISLKPPGMDNRKYLFELNATNKFYNVLRHSLIKKV
jgi:hypothetical protein